MSKAFSKDGYSADPNPFPIRGGEQGANVTMPRHIPISPSPWRFPEKHSFFVKRNPPQRKVRGTFPFSVVWLAQRRLTFAYLFHGRLNVRTKKTAISARVTGLSGQ
jgi:hypothetical protein